MEALAYYDGKIGTPEELMVPFNDRVHFFGDGVYDATVGANGKVYLMQDHLDRFYTSAKALDIHIQMPKEELGRLLTDLLAKVDGTTHFVYWQVTRGVETRNHVYAEDLPGPASCGCPSARTTSTTPMCPSSWTPPRTPASITATSRR